MVQLTNGFVSWTFGFGYWISRRQFN